MAVTPKRFRFRSFVTCSIATSFLASAVSGVVLFLRPEGSLARWTGWSVLGADKGEWEALHIASVILVIAAASLHAWLNRRPLRTAIATRAPAALRPRPELAAALALVAFASWGSIAGWVPFSTVNGLRSSVKDGRFSVRTHPPAANAERLTVRELCERIGLPPDRAVGNARRRGIAIADPSKTLAGIAEEIGRSPEEVFEALADGGERQTKP